MQYLSELMFLIIAFKAGGKEDSLDYLATRTFLIGTGADNSSQFENISNHGVDGFSCYLLGVDVLVVYG